MLVYHSVLIQGSPIVITSATRQGGSVNFIATVLYGLPTPQLGWFGGFFFFFPCFFGSLENGSCITLLPLVALRPPRAMGHTYHQ